MTIRRPPSPARPPRGRLAINDALNGVGAFTAAELLDLIHEVNPTGRDLPRDEETRRYGVKSRLQSLLIRRFPDDVEIGTDPAHPEVVSIDHKFERADGCHALLADLEPDARAWAQRQIDVGDARGGVRGHGGGSAAREGEERASRRPRGADPGDLLEQARAASESFDYDTAQELYRGALQNPKEELRAAVALLELLVDTLADDATALSLATDLTRATAGHGKVRVLVAIAAARSGERERALRLVGTLEDPRCADVFLPLAAESLHAGYVDAATQLLERAREADPRHPGLAPLGEEIARNRARSRAPLEVVLQKLLDGGRLDEAAAQARRILAAWPDSEPARRALRRSEEHRKIEASRAFLADCDRAIASRDPTAASAYLRQALATGVHIEGVARIEQAIAQLEADARTRAGDVAVGRVRALLESVGASSPAGAMTSGERAERLSALTLYVELDAKLRARARVGHATPILGWLDTLADVRGGDPRAKVEAAVALEHASSIAVSEPDRALKLLEGHDRWLRAIGDARAVEGEAHRRVDSLRRTRAEASFYEAWEAFEAGDVSTAQALMRDLVPRDLPEGERAGFEELRVEIASVAANRGLAADVERLRGEGKFLAARDAVDQLIARTNGVARDRWRETRAIVDQELKRSWCFHVCEEPMGAEVLRGWNVAPLDDGVPRWLTADGREILIMEGLDRWIIIRVVDIATGRVRQGVWFRTPEVADTPQLDVDGDLVCIVGRRGETVVLDRTTWDIVRYHHGQTLVSEEIAVQSRLVPPPYRLLWFATKIDDATVGRVIDLQGRQVVRRLGDVYRVFPVGGFDSPVVASVKDDERTFLFGADATPLEHGRLSRLQGGVDDLAIHPDRDGLVALTSDLQLDLPTAPVWWTEAPFGCPPSMPTPLEGADGGKAIGIATSLEADATFIRYSDRDSLDWVVALRRRPGGDDTRSGHGPGSKLRGDGPEISATPRRLEQAWREALPGRGMLVQDAAARRVVGFSIDDDGLHAQVLGTGRPTFHRNDSVNDRAHLGLVANRMCEEHTTDRAEAARATYRQIFLRSKPELEAWIREREASAAGSAQASLELFYVLTFLKQRDRASALLDRLTSELPAEPEVMYLRGLELAQRGDWDEVRAVLGVLDTSKLEGRTAHHVYHLLAIAQIAAGDLDVAQATLVAGISYVREGQCLMHPLFELVHPFYHPFGPEQWGPDQPVERQMLGAICAADDCAEQSDWNGVRDALNRVVVWDMQEVQSMARLAEAYLSGADASQLEIAIGLATFLERVNTPARFLWREMPIPHGMMSAEELMVVAAEATAWLEGRRDPPIQEIEYPEEESVE